MDRNNTKGRKVCFTLLLLALVGGILYGAWVRLVHTPGDQDSSHQPCTKPALDFSHRVPVAINRGPEVVDGFRGEVHPILHRQGELELTANWNFDRYQGEDSAFLRMAPPPLRELFLGLRVSVPTKTYTSRDFSRFLPAEGFGAVGQMWALDQDKVADFLKQFHPSPSMRLVAKGRRAGPDGAFAILRAVSPSHLDILFRIHAEFDVRPESLDPNSRAEAWYSPACFLGRLVIDRNAGAVESFRLGLPTDDAYNVHVSLATGRANSEYHGWMRVDRMELVGGDRESVGGIRWVDQIETGDAHNRLAKVFFKFKEIDWVAFDKVQELARSRKKPIFVVVALGPLDNQTC